MGFWFLDVKFTSYFSTLSTSLSFSLRLAVAFETTEYSTETHPLIMFTKTLNRLCIGFFILSQLHISVCEKSCRHKFTRPVSSGYRCVTETEEYTHITDIQPHICTYRCMQRQGCRIVNYNTRQNTCSLSKDGCILLKKDESFPVKVLSTIQRSECLQWQPPPPPVSGDTSAVLSNMCHQSLECYVGRLKIDNAIVPGKYLHGGSVIYSVLYGTEISNGVQEILTVNQECQVAWMPFNASDTLPTGAVLGGHLEKGDQELYVVRARAGPTLIPLGFYDPVSAPGYLPYYGVQEVTDMEILVLMWTWCMQKQFYSSLCNFP